VSFSLNAGPHALQKDPPRRAAAPQLTCFELPKAFVVPIGLVLDDPFVLSAVRFIGNAVAHCASTDSPQFSAGHNCSTV
jgi:hypothetical protein